jgi:hypothetical protein
MTDTDWELLQYMFDNDELTERDFEHYQKLIALEAQEFLAKAET